MSRGQMVRAWVTAAAEEISALFERTTAESEEELCRSKDENLRKQQLLDVILAPRVLPLNQDFTETQGIKEEPGEQSVSQEEELLPGPVPEFIAVCVKSEETSPRQQRQTELRQETQGEDSSETEADTELSPDTDDDDDDWEPPFCFSAAQMDTEADGDRDKREQSTEKGIKLSSENKTAPGTTANNGGLPRNDDGAEGKKHQCHYCQKRLTTKHALQRHIRVHTGEKPYSCDSCEKTFARKHHLDYHRRTHTGEKPYSCTICKKTFSLKCNLNTHKRLHSGVKLYSCSSCEKTFARKHSLYCQGQVAKTPNSIAIQGKTRQTDNFNVLLARRLRLSKTVQTEDTNFSESSLICRRHISPFIQKSGCAHILHPTT